MPTRKSFMRTLSVATALLCIGTCCALREAPSFKLDDENFEHDTQASTGQTTGTWFVMLHNGSDPHMDRVLPMWRQLAETADLPILFGEVDVEESRGLAKRFRSVERPVFLLFRDGQMYAYRYRPAEYLSMNKLAWSLHHFAADGFQGANPLSVPPPPSLIESVKEELLRVASSAYGLARRLPSELSQYTSQLSQRFGDKPLDAIKQRIGDGPIALFVKLIGKPLEAIKQRIGERPVALFEKLIGRTPLEVAMSCFGAFLLLACAAVPLALVMDRSRRRPSGVTKKEQ